MVRGPQLFGRGAEFNFGRRAFASSVVDTVIQLHELHELELELIVTRMIQKQVLWVGKCVCA